MTTPAPEPRPGRSEEAVPAEIARALEHLQSGEAEARRKAFGEVLALGLPRAVEVLSSLLGDMGRTEDTGARLALHGLALHVGRPGAEAEREAFSRAAAERLQANLPQAASRKDAAPCTPEHFLLECLQAAGRAEAVPALAHSLAVETLAEAARQALVANPSRAAVEALREALPRAKGTLRVGIIHALGLRRDAASVEALLAETERGEPEARLAALEAVAWTGDRRAVPALERALTLHTEGRAARLVVDACASLAEEFLAAEPAEALKLYRSLLAAAQNNAARCAALGGLARAGGPAEVPAVAALAQDRDPAVRQAALEALAGMPGREVTRAISDAAGAASGEAQAALQGILKKRQPPL